MNGMALGLGMTVRFGWHYLYKWDEPSVHQLNYLERLAAIHTGRNSLEVSPQVPSSGRKRFGKCLTEIFTKSLAIEKFPSCRSEP